METNKWSLRGTGSHPIFANGKWLPLAECYQGHTLCGPDYRRLALWLLRRKMASSARRLFLTARNTIDTRTREIRRIASIFLEREAAYTGMYGYTTGGQSQKGSRSITLMRTPVTTPLKTLSAFLSGLIGPNTPIRIGRLGRSKGAIWNQLGIWQPNGTKAQRDENGIKDAPLQRSGSQERPSPIAKAIMRGLAGGAARLLRPRVLKRDFVAQGVRKPKADTVWVNSVRSLNTTCAVYNITVEDAGCYYANGILVHNCDTVSMAAKFLRDNGLLTRAPERLSEIEDSKVYLGRAPRALYPG